MLMRILYLALLCSIHSTSASYWYIGDAQRNKWPLMIPLDSASRPGHVEDGQWYQHTRRHRKYGLQDFSTKPSPIKGRVWNVDCLGFQCISGCAQGPCTPPASGRRLGHGAGGSLPVSPMPDITMPATVPCDMNTVLDGRNFAGKGIIGGVTFTWFVVCLSIPRSSSSLATFAGKNLLALIFFYPYSTAIVTNFGATMFDVNPVPDLPIVWACVDGEIGRPVEERLMPMDEHSVYACLVVMGMNFINLVTDGWGYCWYDMTDDDNVLYDTLNNGANYFFLFLWSAISFLIVFYSFYLLRTRRPLLVSFVIVCEGILTSTVRGVRCGFSAPFAQNRFAGVDMLSMWMLAYLDAGPSAAATFVSAMMWVKIVLGRQSTAQFERRFHVVVAVMASALGFAIFFVSICYPLQIYNPALAISRAGLGYGVGIPVMLFIGIFIISTCVALRKLLSSAKMSSSMQNSLRRLLPSVLLQLLGLILYSTNVILAEYVLAPALGGDPCDSAGYMDICIAAYSGQLNNFGSLLATIGQLRMLTSSSSSSSSSNH